MILNVFVDKHFVKQFCLAVGFMGLSGYLNFK